MVIWRHSFYYLSFNLRRDMNPFYPYPITRKYGDEYLLVHVHSSHCKSGSTR